MTHLTPNIITALAIVALLLIVIFLKRNRKTASDNQYTQIYVGNLPYKVSEFDLKRFFAPYGTITHARVVRNHRTGQSKGYAFVTFSSGSALQKSLEAHGQTLKGRNLVVRIAKPKTESSETQEHAA